MPKELNKPKYSNPFDELVGDFRMAQLILTAHRLGVFEALKSEAKESSLLAAECGADRRGCRILLDALAAIGVLEKTEELYSNSELVKEEILAGGAGKASMLTFQAELYEKWGKLFEVVKNGAPVDESELTQGLKVDQELFASAMKEASFKSAAATAEALDLSQTKSFLDVGGGIGAYAVEFLKVNPAIKVSVLDQEKTVELAKRNLEELGIADRVELIAGDLFEAALEDEYDLILLSNILHMFPPESAQKIVEKYASHLSPGGVLCVKDWLVSANRTAPLGTALFAVNMYLSNTGDCYTAEEIQNWCEQAGLVLTETKELPTPAQLVLCTKPRA